VTAPFSGFAANDIIEASGQGTLFKITPPSDGGWLAYVQSEDTLYNFQGAAWISLAATQADMEGDSSLIRYVPPGRMKFSPGVAKAWGVFNGTGVVALGSAYNVSSITDNGVGHYLVNFNTPMSTSSYSANAIGSLSLSGTAFTDLMDALVNTLSTSSFRILTGDRTGPVPLDPVVCCFQAFGDFT
jgi:hypothetical protein